MKIILSRAMKEKKIKERIYGNRIKAILKEKGMTQHELAQMTGIEPSHVSKIILGKRRCISLPIAFKISEALKKPIEDIFIASRTKIKNENDMN